MGSKTATGTITDNDTAGLVLGTVSGNTTEAGGTATFTVKLASQPTSDVTMSVSSSDTTEGTVTQTLTFTAANWNTTQTVTVTGADDLLVDGNVAYQALLSTSSSDSSYNNRTGAADITNTDNDVQTITVRPPANKVSEGSVAPFTVTLGKVATSATVVTLTLGSDSDAGTANATSGTDYSANLLVTYKRSSDNTVVTETVASGGTVSLAAGETSFKVLASTSADSPRVFEGDEVFTFTAAITGASDTRAVTISDDGSGTVYKNDGSVDAEASKDDDRPSIASVSVVDADNRSASPADTSVVEGGTLEFTVTLSNASLSATQFALNEGGTALVTDYGDLQFSNGVTYNSETGRLSVPAGVTSFTVTVATVDDAVIENAETLILDVGGVSATGTITDNDEPPPAPAPAPAPAPTPTPPPRR